MSDFQLYPTATAAMMLGLTVETLRSWRRRGVGPAYTKSRGGHLRRGIHHRGEHWHDKAHGTIVYPAKKLQAYVDARLVPRGRLPRPVPGRLPGGKNRNVTSHQEATVAGGGAPSHNGVRYLQFLDPTTFAYLLGVTPDTLRSWRRRGIGPAYVRFPGGHVRHGKALGHIRYPQDELKSYLRAWISQLERLPRPVLGGNAHENSRACQ